MNHSLTISCTEQNNPWKSKEVIGKAIDCIVNNPFATIDTMDFQAKNKWAPFNREKAIETLLKKDGFVSLTDSEHHIDGSVSKNIRVNKVRIEAMLEEKDATVDKLLTYFEKITSVLPEFEKGDAGCDLMIRSVYEKFDIESAPPCFTSQLAWAHIISPRGYKDYFSKEELLAIPEVSLIKELEDDKILIMIYDYPFDYDKPENIEKIKKVTTYLNERRLDWKNAE